MDVSEIGYIWLRQSGAQAEPWGYVNKTIRDGKEIIFAKKKKIVKTYARLFETLIKIGDQAVTKILKIISITQGEIK